MKTKEGLKRYDMTLDELKTTLAVQGVKVRPSYCHDDYRTATFSFPYPIMDKLTAASIKYDVSKSKIIRLLIDNMSEKDLAAQLGFKE